MPAAKTAMIKLTIGLRPALNIDKAPAYAPTAINAL
ncbi:unannotated protein [freshwater metagenome]|uniref:Unannotated protein n=1 Tax=freshwater metagenome TaxID=449393 RepID=A0A6J6P7E8_9ZZZZ